MLGAQIEAVFFCPHAPDARCRCRKPQPGLLEDIERRLRVELKGVPVIGDSLGDVQCASAVGASPLLVRTGKGDMTIRAHRNELRRIPVYQNLSSAADALLAH
jgi:D-glycero-D-manno-heptose 1,7-bisphosphate phosphatase